MATPDEIRRLKEAVTAAKAEMDRLLGSADGLQRNAIKASQAYKDQVIILREANQQIKEALNIQKQSTDALIEQESRLKGLTGLQASLVDLDRRRIELQDKIDGSYLSTHDSLNSIASLNQQLLSMSAEDRLGREKIEKSISEELDALIAEEGITDEIVQNMTAQFEKAKSISSMTEKQKDFLQKQLDVYDGIKDTIGGVLETASLLSKTTEGKIGGAIILASKAMGKMGEIAREMGEGPFTLLTAKASALSVIFPNITETIQGMGRELGNMNEASTKQLIQSSLIATNYGISGDEVAKITGSFTRLTGQSVEYTNALMQSTAQFAEQNGVSRKIVMGDLAANAEHFAKYNSSATNSLMKSVVQARQLAISFDTMENMASGLLDFETSITKELELGVLLGRQVNFNLARQHALSGDLGLMTREIVNQIGGEAAWNKMNRIERQMVADAMGQGVDEMDKMIKNMDKLNAQGEIQLSTFDTFKQTLEGIASSPMWSTILSSIGAIVIAWGQSEFLARGLKDTLGPVVDSTKKIAENMEKLGGGNIPEALVPGAEDIANTIMDGDDVKGKLTEDISNTLMGDDGGTSKLTKSVSKIKMSDVLQGAAALVLIAGAMWILGKALQEFQGIGWDTLAVAGTSLLGLTLALAAVGAIMKFAGPFILIGAAAMITIAGAIWILGKALQEISVGFEALKTIEPILGSLVSMVGGIFLLSLAFTSLAASLSVLAVAGILAMPTLLALGGLGIVAAKVFGKNTDTDSRSNLQKVEDSNVSQYHTDMLTKMDQLIEAVRAPANVILDGNKVGELIRPKIERANGNITGIKSR
jgi:hypothetical protein